MPVLGDSPVERRVGAVRALEERTVAIERPALDRQIPRRDVVHVAARSPRHPLIELAEEVRPAHATLGIRRVDRAADHGIAPAVRRDDLANPVWIRDAVRVGEGQDLAFRARRAEIAGFAWKLPIRERMEVDPGEAPSDIRGSVRGAVNDDDFERIVALLALQSGQTTLDGIESVEGGHDHGDLRARHRRIGV